jgi:hypothetical protein
MALGQCSEPDPYTPHPAGNAVGGGLVVVAKFYAAHRDLLKGPILYKTPVSHASSTLATRQHRVAQPPMAHGACLRRPLLPPSAVERVERRFPPAPSHWFLKVQPRQWPTSSVYRGEIRSARMASLRRTNATTWSADNRSTRRATGDRRTPGLAMSTKASLATPVRWPPRVPPAAQTTGSRPRSSARRSIVSSVPRAPIARMAADRRDPASRRWGPGWSS